MSGVNGAVLAGCDNPGIGDAIQAWKRWYPTRSETSLDPPAVSDDRERSGGMFRRVDYERTIGKRRGASERFANEPLRRRAGGRQFPNTIPRVIDQPYEI